MSRRQSFPAPAPRRAVARTRFSRARGLRCKPAGSRRPRAATHSTCSRPCCSHSRSTPRHRPRSRRPCSCCCNVRSRNSMPAASRKPNGWCNACSPWCPTTGPAQVLARRINPPDTPSRQLSREQRRRGRSAAGREHAGCSAAPPSTAPQPRGRLQKSRPNSLRCRGRSRSCLVRPTPPTTAAPQASPPVVRPDPLAPRHRQSDADVRPDGAQLRARASECPADGGHGRPSAPSRRR